MLLGGKGREGTRCASELMFRGCGEERSIMKYFSSIGNRAGSIRRNCPAEQKNFKRGFESTAAGLFLQPD